ncbi:MAG: hypothetical protein C0176_07135 [Mesoaciditoga sp.]|uniref:hypothetical protein n=1 Tax=Athalassotoga sp. TaxID=2022597 RepID=UPI000CC8B372|nr:MAG: hypothetical protein C0176_07135 [Mesoaciditoga sp.]HEU24133.1 hypothetical protein [Mesoaciditoga lauensis]
MEDVFKKLEEAVDQLLNERENLFKKVQSLNFEVENLKAENNELKEMLNEQSIRVEVLIKKLQDILNLNKRESAISDEEDNNL